MKPMPAIPMPLTLGDLRRACNMSDGARERLEDALADYHDATAAFGVSSGRTALWLALRALHGVRPDRDVVIVPSYTCPTVGRAVVEAGLRGRCADVSLQTLTLDPNRVGEVIDDRVLAVVAPHMFGLPCDVTSLGAICAEHGAFLVEDCAQCVGGRWAGECVGTVGDVAFLSMGRSKNVRGYEGGVLWTKRNDLVDALAEQFGQLPEAQSGASDRMRQAAITVASKPYVWAAARNLPGLGVGEEDQAFDPRPSKLADWQAGLGLISLERLEAYNGRRRELAHALREALAGVSTLELQAVPDEAESTSLRFAARAVDGEQARDALVRRLQSRNIDARAFYTRTMNEYPWWEGEADRAQVQVATQVVQTNVILPIPAGASIQSMEALAAEVARP